MRWPEDEEEVEASVAVVRRPGRRGGATYRRTGGRYRNSKKGQRFDVVQTLSKYIFGG